MGRVDYELGRLRTATRAFPDGQWCVIWWEGDQRRRYRLKVSLKEPESVARLKFNEFVRVRNRALAAENRLTIGDVMDLYFDDRANEGKSIEGMRTLWRANLKPVFGLAKPEDLKSPVSVAGVKRTLCHKYAYDREKAGKSRATIYHELNILRTGLKWGAADGREIIKPARVWLPRRARPRDSQLTWDDIFAVYEACRKWPHLKLFMLLDITTTQRKGAILDLEWDRVDFERRQIRFERDRDRESILDTGGQKGRSSVDMGDLVYRELTEAKLFAQSTFVIEWRGKRIKDVKKGLKVAFKAAGITKPFAGAHAIRKSVAGLLADAGEEMRRIQKLLGHHDIGTTDRIYAHHSPGYLTQAVGLIEAVIASRTAIEPETPIEHGEEPGQIEGEILNSRFDELLPSNLEYGKSLKSLVPLA